jgi:hypothetical protein
VIERATAPAASPYSSGERNSRQTSAYSARKPWRSRTADLRLEDGEISEPVPPPARQSREERDGNRPLEVKMAVGDPER